MRKTAGRFWAAAVLTGLLVMSCAPAPTLTPRDPSPHDLALAATFARATGDAADAAAPLPDRWRRAEARLYLSRRGPVAPDARFLFTTADTRETEIALHAVGRADIALRVQCDGTTNLRSDGRPLRVLRPGSQVDFVLPAGSEGTLRLVPGPDVTRCDLQGPGWTLPLLRQDLADPDLARLDARRDLCAVPDPATLDPLAAAFHADRALSQTCAQPIGRVEMLPGSLQALNARIAALTGRPADPDALLAGNPDMPLDFSAAPDLDLIYLSYLHIRADYSGYLMARMLAYHALRGTVVRILMTDTLMLPPERAFLADLAALYPNIQVQYYRWDRPGIGSPSDQIDRLQRSQHIKIFATLSATPGANLAIVGGRNIHDGFFFDRAFDLSAYPYLRSYDAGGMQDLAFYSVYEDFEVALHDPSAVQAIAAQLSTVWNRDLTTQVARPLAVPDPAAGPAPVGGMRHFVSLPWADAEAQVGYFVDLFDAARSDITIVTPFLYPPPAIEAAWRRAAARGVRVRIIARIDSTDPSGVIVSALNREFIARNADVFEIHGYTPPGRMLHAKLVLIDERLAVVTSTNFNQRSFVHDTENGVTFLDPGMVARIGAQVDAYLAGAMPVARDGTTGLPVPRFRPGLTDALADLLTGSGWMLQYF